MFSIFSKKDNQKKEKEQKVYIKPSESLGSVLSESVPAASLDIIRNNTAFQIADDENGNARYVVATLDVTDIGGLNRRMKHNPDKGQFIECVNCGNIEAYVSAEGIEFNQFVIIPTEKTLEALSEFSFLSNKEKFADFIPTCVIVDRNGNMEFIESEARVDYNWFLNIANGVTSVISSFESITKDEKSGIHSSTEEHKEISEYQEQEDSKKPLPNRETDNSDEETGSIVKEMTEQIASEVQEVLETGMDERTDFTDTEKSLNDQDDVKDAYADLFDNDEGILECPICHNLMNYEEPCPSCGFDPNEETHYPDEFQEEFEEKQDEIEMVPDIDVSMAVERLFHVGDLDLEISAQPFDVQFIKENNFIPISEERGDGWLDGYVTQLIKNANAELLQLHQMNLFASRNRYLSIITEECENIAKSVDLNEPSNPYSRMKQTIIDNVSKKKSEIEIEVDRRRAALQQTWDKELAMIEESAAAAARRNYLDKHARSHEASLRDVESSLIDEIDIEYSKLITELNEKRRTEAKRLLDIAVTQTLNVIGHSYEEALNEENERREQLLAEIQEYVDMHRKDEVARNAVMAEEQRQKDEATRVADEYIRKIDMLTSEHDAACKKFIQELDAAHAHEETIKTDFSARIDNEQEKYKELDEKYQNLMDRYVGMDAEKTKEFETYLNTLENDKKAAEEHLAHVDIMHNRYNKVSVAVWVAVSVATFAIGALVGSRYLTGSSIPADGHYSISLTAPSMDQGEDIGDKQAEDELENRRK